MATEAQRLVHKRARLLRDLAGCRAQLMRIREGLQTHLNKPSDVSWIQSAIDLLESRDTCCRLEWGYRPIPTYAQWEAEHATKLERHRKKLAKKFPQILQEHL
jgi:hypothetical protein